MMVTATSTTVVQALREAPTPALERASVKRWRLWARSHAKFLSKSVRTLRAVKDNRPARLLQAHDH